MQRTRCPKCRERVPSAALQCNRCGTFFSEWEAEQAERLEGLSQRVADDIAKRVVKRLFRWRVLPVATVVLGLFGWGLHEVLQYADRQIAERFAEPRVRQTFEEVVNRAAEQLAGRLMHDRLDPAVRRAEEFIANEKAALTARVEEIRGSFQAELEELRRDAAYWNNVREIQRWEDRALDGDPEALRLLDSYSNDDSDLKSRATAAVLSVRGFYLMKTRVPEKLWIENPDGSRREEQDFSTAELIHGLLNDPRREIRARAAHLLGQKREQGVPEALVRAMSTDPWLWARHEALSSFESITQWRAPAALAFEDAQTWWAEHTDEIRQGLTSQATPTPIPIASAFPKP